MGGFSYSNECLVYLGRFFLHVHYLVQQGLGQVQKSANQLCKGRRMVMMDEKPNVVFNENNVVYSYPGHQKFGRRKYRHRC